MERTMLTRAVRSSRYQKHRNTPCRRTHMAVGAVIRCHIISFEQSVLHFGPNMSSGSMRAFDFAHASVLQWSRGQPPPPHPCESGLLFGLELLQLEPGKKWNIGVWGRDHPRQRWSTVIQGGRTRAGHYARPQFTHPQQYSSPDGSSSPSTTPAPPARLPRSKEGVSIVCQWPALARARYTRDTV